MALPQRAELGTAADDESVRVIHAYLCRELGIGITAYGVLAKGLIGDGTDPNHDARAMFPRFQGTNREHNDALVARLRGLAEAKEVSLAQLAIAWVAARGDDIVPIVGSRRIEQVPTLIDSNHTSLDDGDLAAIDELIPRGAAQGDRYPTAFMADLDSER